MVEGFPTQCGISGHPFVDEDIIIVEQVEAEGETPGYPRFVKKEFHDENLTVLDEVTYAELKLRGEKAE